MLTLTNKQTYTKATQCGKVLRHRRLTSATDQLAATEIASSIAFIQLLFVIVVVVVFNTRDGKHLNCRLNTQYFERKKEKNSQDVF